MIHHVSVSDPPPVVKNCVKLRSRTVLKLATTACTLPQQVSVCNVSTAAAGVSEGVAMVDIGATHHLWPSYDAFISQYVMLPNNTSISILGTGVIAVELGGNRLVIRNIYHVPALRLPLFSLCCHCHIQGCGFHGNKDNFGVFFPTFCPRWMTTRTDMLYDGC